nr:ATP synthase F0 subunit 6 [Perisphaerus sp. 2 ZQW-2023b]
MMTNLFSVFDPTTNFYNLSLNWMSTFLGMTLLPWSFWLIPSRHFIQWYKIITYLHKEFKVMINYSNLMNKGSTFIFISTFSIIMFNNFMGLFPYIFTSTSHLVMTLTMALPLWLTFMMFGWINNSYSMFAHLVPQGTPSLLMPFMVCIETISNFIRPGTLAIRLSANMIAGHLLLTLLGNSSINIPMSMLIMMIFTQIMLLILESAVAIIQSYVFTVLSMLYSSEVN